jgi:hypothetical protein
MDFKKLSDGITDLIEKLNAYKKAKKAKSVGVFAAARSGASVFRQVVGGESQSNKLEIIDQTLSALQESLDALNNPKISVEKHKEIILHAAEQVARLEGLKSSNEFNQGQLRDDNVNAIMLEANQLKHAELKNDFNEGNEALSDLSDFKYIEESWTVDDDLNVTGHQGDGVTLGFKASLKSKESSELRTAREALTSAQTDLLEATKSGNLSQTHIDKLDKAYSNLASVAGGFKIKNDTKGGLVKEYIGEVRKQQVGALKQAQEALKFQTPPAKPAMQSAQGKKNSEQLMGAMSGKCRQEVTHANSTRDKPT